jgi:hypothetical protein
LKAIPLTQGYVSFVDNEDYEELSKYKWRASVQPNGRVYAIRSQRNPLKKTQDTIFMHRVITDASRGMDVDHIDGNGLNNTRSNLRVCSRSENLRNQRLHSDNTSGFKGVSYHKRDRKWQARIRVNGKQHFLGYFDTPEAAARAYDTAALHYFGEFARLNFPITAIEPALAA